LILEKGEKAGVAGRPQRRKQFSKLNAERWWRRDGEYWNEDCESSNPDVAIFANVTVLAFLFSFFYPRSHARTTEESWIFRKVFPGYFLGGKKLWLGHLVDAPFYGGRLPLFTAL